MRSGIKISRISFDLGQSNLVSPMDSQSTTVRSNHGIGSFSHRGGPINREQVLLIGEALKFSEKDALKNMQGLWSGTMLFSIDEVIAQVETGRRVSAGLEKFFKQYVRIQMTFASEMQKLFESQKNSLMSMEVPDKLTSVYVTALGLLSNATVLGDIHKEHACHVRDNVATVFSEFQGIQEERIRNCKSQSREVLESVASVKHSVDKSKARVLRKLNMKVVSQKTNLIGKVAGKLTSTDDSILDAAVAYDNFVQDCNSSLSEYVWDFKPVIRQSQDIETMRYLYIRKMSQDYVDTFVPLANKYVELAESIKDISAIMNLQTDMEGFVNQSHPVGDVDKFTCIYDLPITIKELKNRAGIARLTNFTEKGKFPEWSVPQWMESQNVNYPELQVPLIFIRIRAALHRASGFQEEGIFRISGGKESMVEYIERIKLGDFSGGTNVNVIAGVLKQWLRELAEPLVPYDMYEQCIELGSSQQPSVESVTDLISRVPTSRKALIHCITHFVREISHPRNVDSTKMNTTNLAIVFAPAVIYAKPTSLVDPNLLFAQSKSQIAFMTHVFNKLTLEPELLHLDMDMEFGEVDPYAYTLRQIVMDGAISS